MRFALVMLSALCVVTCSRDRSNGAAGSGAAGSGAEARIVSLTPSATEVIAALDATRLLVGVDDYSRYPPEVDQLPKVGSFLTPNLEAIVALRPTLVVVDDIHGRTAGALADAGIATIACAIHNLADVKAALRTVGARIGRTSKADQAIAEIDTAIAAAIAARPATRPRVLAIIDREAGGLGSLIGAGPGSWVDELLAVVGGHNVLDTATTRYPKISREEVIRAQPTLILDLSYPARQGIEVWRTIDVPAVKAGHVVALTEPFLIAPSPRVKQALEALASALKS